MSGVKYDAGKPRLDLLPPKAVMALGEVMTYGAAKYGADNWQGVASERYSGRLRRRKNRRKQKEEKRDG